MMKKADIVLLKLGRSSESTRSLSCAGLYVQSSLEVHFRRNPASSLTKNISVSMAELFYEFFKDVDQIRACIIKKHILLFHSLDFACRIVPRLLLLSNTQSELFKIHLVDIQAAPSYQEISRVREMKSSSNIQFR